MGAKLYFMQLVHHPGYDLHLGDHVFPSAKFQLLRDSLLAQRLVDEEAILRPDPATRDQLCLVHDPEWVDALSHGTLTMQQIVRLEIPYSAQMVRAFKLMCGGTILAARQALAHGWAMNLGGGFHHAFPGHGEGFCALHDVAVAAAVLRAEGTVGRVLILDCDVHHGNGTAAIFADEPEVFTLSLHQYNNYPSAKPPSNVDVHLPDGTGDDEYLRRLREVLAAVAPAFRPELVLYIAGADPYEDDRLGGLKMTRPGLAARDALVLNAFPLTPVAVTLAGGYARKLADTVAIHAETARAGLQSRSGPN